MQLLCRMPERVTVSAVKDANLSIPPKKELIIPVDLSAEQRILYKAVLTKNYEVRAESAHVSCRFE